MKKYFWMGKELKIVVTYKNNPFYKKVMESKHGCYIDHFDCKIRVIYNRAYNVVKQGIEQDMQIIEEVA